MGFESTPNVEKKESFGERMKKAAEKWKNAILESRKTRRQLEDDQYVANETNKSYENMKRDVLESFPARILGIIGFGTTPPDYGPEDDAELNEVLDDELNYLNEIRSFERDLLGMKEDSAWLKEQLEVVEMTRP